MCILFPISDLQKWYQTILAPRKFFVRSKEEIVPCSNAKNFLLHKARKNVMNFHFFLVAIPTFLPLLSATTGLC